MMSDRCPAYEKPKITDERKFETQALSCGKTPPEPRAECGGGIGVWASPHGNQTGCEMNTLARSS